MLTWKKRVSTLDIIAVMLYIAIFKFFVGPQILQQAVKIFFIGIILIYLFRRVSWKKLRNTLTMMVLSFMLSSLIGAIHGDVAGKAVLDGILYATCIFCSYGVTQQFARKDKLDRFIDIVFVMTEIYSAISLISIYFVGVSIYGTEKEYFFGNKFSTSYFFILLAGLYYVKNFRIRKNHKVRIVFFLLSIAAFSVSYWVHCNTTVLGTVALIVGTVLPDFMKEKLQSKKLIVILIAITGLFPFFVENILEITQIQYLFYQVMGKSLGLTGRTHIYNLLPSFIAERPMFGYGYNNFIVETTVGYGNAQNGLMELVLAFGFVGMVIFILMVYRHLNVKPILKNYGLYIVLYTLIFCSTVEVSYNYFFYLSLFIIYFGSERKLG